jgi:tripartite-type tricarboxylate transporter receptor subunit TctC
MKRERSCMTGAVAALALLLVPTWGAAAAETAKRVFDARPIQVVVGFPAGGIFDTVNRILTTRMAREVGVNMVPVPHPGAGGAIAMQRVARGTPDGHTIMLVPTASLLSRPTMMGLNIDHRDFAPIATVAINFTMIAVKNDHRWKALEDLIKDAQASPGKYSYALPSVGGNPHFAMELVSRATGIRVVPIPYQGSPQAIMGVLGNEADFVVTDNVHPQIRSLATLNAKRSPFQPSVPTLRELGFDVELFSRFILVAPKGTPVARVQALEIAARTAVEDPEVRKLIERQQLQVMFESAQQLALVWEQQAPMYRRLIDDLGLAHKPTVAPAAKR